MIILSKKKLEEKLEPATEYQFGLLQKQIESDPETKRMLTSLIRDIPQYRWLCPENYADYHSLLDILKFLVFFEKRGILLFSKAGNKFTGFLIYLDEGKKISGIKMASFFDDEKKSNVVIATDLVKFIDKEVARREKIEWDVYVQNVQAVSQYEKFLKNRFIWTRVKDSTGFKWIYTVTGKK